MEPRRSNLMSPCINICVMDSQAELCAGCGRTIAEIEAWARYTDDERQAIMITLPERLATLSKGPLLETES